MYIGPVRPQCSFVVSVVIDVFLSILVLPFYGFVMYIELHYGIMDIGQLGVLLTAVAAAVLQPV